MNSMWFKLKKFSIYSFQYVFILIFAQLKGTVSDTLRELFKLALFDKNPDAITAVNELQYQVI